VPGRKKARDSDQQTKKERSLSKMKKKHSLEKSIVISNRKQLP